MSLENIVVLPYKRKYLDTSITCKSWASFLPFVEKLQHQNLNTPEDLLDFLHKKNELDIILNQKFL